MADFHVYRDRLVIRLTRAEKVLALRRDDIVVPRDSIRSVAITADPWIWIRGVRAPGNSIPLTLAVGTWKFHGGKDFLVLKGKQRSAIVIDIEQPEQGENPGQAEPAEKDDEKQGTRARRRRGRLQQAMAGGTVDDGAADDRGASDGAASDGAVSEPPTTDGDAASGEPEEVAGGFSRVIVSTQHASELVEALRDIRPGSDGPVDEVIGS